MSDKNFDKIVNDLVDNLINNFEENGQRTYKQIRRNFGELSSKFEEIMFEVKKKLEEKGYTFDYFIQIFDGETDTCIAEFKKKEVDEDEEENWYD